MTSKEALKILKDATDKVLKCDEVKILSRDQIRFMEAVYIASQALNREVQVGEKRGHWIPDPSLDDLWYSHYRCSVCGKGVDLYHGGDPKVVYPYCNCGARMDEEEE